VPGLDASAIEQARDLPIRHPAGQLTHECDRVVGDAWIVPAGRIQSLFDLQLGMVAAFQRRTAWMMARPCARRSP